MARLAEYPGLRYGVIGTTPAPTSPALSQCTKLPPPTALRSKVRQLVLGASGALLVAKALVGRPILGDRSNILQA